MIFLTRLDKIEDRLLGELKDEDQNFIAFTLERLFPHGKLPPSLLPKIPEGVYPCVRGMHSLEHHPKPFEAFEITKVAGHEGLLFHIGNYVSETNGCILLGEAIVNDEYLLHSGEAFQKFMHHFYGRNQFDLKITS